MCKDNGDNYSNLGSRMLLEDAMNDKMELRCNWCYVPLTKRYFYIATQDLKFLRSSLLLSLIDGAILLFFRMWKSL